MNTFAALQARCDALAAELNALQQLLAQIAAQRDAFASHVLAARRSYKRVALADKTKHGRRAETEAECSYRRAQAIGYRGTLYEWLRILHPPLTPASEA